MILLTYQNSSQCRHALFDALDSELRIQKSLNLKLMMTIFVYDFAQVGEI